MRLVTWAGALERHFRIFKLTYKVSFGNKVLKQKRERYTTSEEEQKGVQ
jgi:hypothetical protein